MAAEIVPIMNSNINRIYAEQLTADAELTARQLALAYSYDHLNSLLFGLQAACDDYLVHDHTRLLQRALGLRTIIDVNNAIESASEHCARLSGDAVEDEAFRLQKVSR